MKTLALTGDHAATESMRQINPDVVAAYPITPQTEIVMAFSQMAANGLVDTELIPVESEHSAMSACVGSQAAGARTMTATSSQGLALMWEVLYIAAGLRLPIVMHCVNRALSAPINIHGDHSDGMGARDSGWIQIYCENAQEVYEMGIMAIRVAEHSKILLPTMVCQDGFITSHAIEGVNILDDADVKKYVGEYKPEQPLLDIKNPSTLGAIELQDYYFEHRYQMAEAMREAKRQLPAIFAEFNKFSGKNFNLIDKYKMDDAEVAILALSSTCGTARMIVDELRDKGIKAGLVKVTVYRPFPVEEVVAACKNLKALAVLDRADSCAAQGGPVFTDVCSAIYTNLDRKFPVSNYIYGLGGRDMDEAQLRNIFNETLENAKSGKVKKLVNYSGVRI